MLDNVKNVFTNRRFQFGLALIAIFGVVFSGFYLNNDDTTITTEDAASISSEVETTEHNQTPTINDQDETLGEVTSENTAAPSDVNVNTTNETTNNEEN